MNDEDDRKAEKTADVATPAPESSDDPPAIDFHDPFGRFDFEPTDGGDF